jgi:pimeloyl-ACP methyl ester carboxylesterase
MPYFEHQAIRFHFDERGEGMPFVFQHGLGSDLNQPLGLVSPPPGCRLLSFDFRAHGLTEPIGPHQDVSICRFADDLAAFLDYLGIERAIVGGISLGAAVALNFAVRFTSRVRGLVLSRPAWFVGPNYENASRFILIASLLRQFGPRQGKQFFQQTRGYREVLAESSESASSLMSQFDAPGSVERAVRLDHIAVDAPVHDIDEFKKIDVPAMVLANKKDPIHDYALGLQVADAIQVAEFQEITSKAISVDRHSEDVQLHVSGFLKRHFL